MIKPGKEEPAKPKFAVGAPYFKSERDPSEGSKRTKAKTGHVCSEVSGNDSDNNRREDQEIPKTIISYVHFDDGANWDFHQPASPKEGSRSRSQGKSEDYEPTYTQSIKELVVME